MLKTFQKDNFKIDVYGTVEQPYFRAHDIATMLGYIKPRNAILAHVDAEDKITYDKIMGPQNRALIKIHPQTIFINESGLYSLILSSKLPQAKEFKRWITSEVLPSIRKHGQYIEKEVKQKLSFNLQCEADLQKAIVNYLRAKHPQIYFIATLGELQDTSEKRIESYNRGYQKGSPDLIIFFRNRKFNGLVIEFKSPQGTGVLTPEQEIRLLYLKNQKFDILVSNDIFEITEKICLHIYNNKISQRSKKPAKPILRRKTILDYLI